MLRTYLVYNTVVQLCHFFCCGRKVNFVRIFLLNPIFLLVHRKFSSPTYVSFSCFVWIYNHTVTIVSQKYWELCLISETILIGFLYFRENNSLIFRTGVSCFSVTLFYSTLLALTDRQNDWRRNKYTRYTWAGGTFFPVVLLFQFFVLAGNRFWFYILLMYLGYHTVVVLC